MRRPALLLAGLAVAATACSSHPPPAPSAGPLAPVSKTSWSPTVRVGQTWTDGWNVLHLRGSRAAVVDDVRLLTEAKGLRLVGVALSDKGHRTTEQFDESWPPTSPLIPKATIVPAKGATIQPGRNYELLLGIEATRPGYLVRRGVVVDYHVGDAHYSRRLESWQAVCTSKKFWKTYDGTRLCPQPPGFAK